MTYITHRDDLLRYAKQIAMQYRTQGLKLTVRQLYYQFVARGLLPSGQNEYKKIVDTLSKARYAGKFDNDLIEDRTRTVYQGDFTRNDHRVSPALDKAADYIRAIPEWTLARDRWYGQNTHVSVWVEKEALAGIFEPVCKSLGVSWLACKGCPSVSALWDWVKGARDAKDYGGGDYEFHQSVILYFGDHDPTGFMIPRAAHEGIEKLQRSDQDIEWMSKEEREEWEWEWEGSDEHLEVTVKRVALNMNQIRKYNPPPFWAKTSDTRYKGYVREHGTTDAWELDALDPSVLRALIQSEVNHYFDEEIHRMNNEFIEERRAQMRDKMSNPDWIASVLRGE